MSTSANRLTAKVRRVTGLAHHRTSPHGDPRPMPDPDRVEIVPDPSGWFLVRLDAAGAPIADSWHATVDEAKSQAKMEYEIGPDDWAVVPPRPEG